MTTEHPVNTISVTVYTPSGTQAYINFGSLVTAAELDSKVAELGYLVNAPGLAANEDLETITHVIRRTQHNKSDGTQTPCLGLYFENPKLNYAKKAYLNTPEDIATFERLSGLKLANLPNYPGQIPLRSDVDAATYIVAAKTPFQIIMKDDTYTDEKTGEVKPTRSFAGFYEVSKPAPTHPASGNGSGQQGSGKQGEPVIVWTQDEQKSFWKHWNGDKQIAKGVILDVLGVKALGDFKNSLDRANTLMEMETRPKASGQ